MALVDVLRLLVAALLGTAALMGHTPLLVLAPAAFLHGFGGGAFLPAARTVMPRLLPEHELVAANSLYSAMTQVGSLIGPAIGGAAVVLAGSGVAVLVDAATFGISAATLLAIRTPRVGEASAVREDGSRAETDLGGPTFATVLRHGKLLHAFLTAAFLLNLSFAGTIQVALPTLAHQEFSAQGYGAMLFGLAAGGLAGALVGRLRWGSRRPTMQVSVITIAMGAALALAPWAGGFIGAAICMAMVGAGDAASGIIIVSMIQVWAPPRVLGRVMSVIMFGVMGLFPVSVAITGYLIDAAGVRAFFPIAGAVSVLAIVVAIMNPAFRQFRAGDRFVAPPSERARDRREPSLDSA